MRLYAGVVEQYADFARYAGGSSPCFERWALGVTEDEEVQALVAGLPPVKQQPNLVFAAARWHGTPAPAPYELLRRHLLDRWDDVRETVLRRSTQTNEIGRLATLVPVLADLQQRTQRPLALLEVGASAGLCLVPDRVGYRWHTGHDVVAVAPPTAAAPVLSCAVTGPAPLPDHLLSVGWRCGLDLRPVDVQDDDALAWLQTLVWPEHEERRARLAAAAAVAREDPPPVVAGDLLTALPALLAQVPDGLTPVVFHSAVAAYLEPSERRRFSSTMTRLVDDGACTWVSNEAPEVLPQVAAGAPGSSGGRTGFVLGVNGLARASTDPHGASMTWWG